MNITIITDVFPYPLSSGGAQAQYNIIDVLRKKHNITLLCILKKSVKTQDVEALKERWNDVNIDTISYKSQLFNLPFLISRIDRAVKLKLFAEKQWFKVERILKPYGIIISKNIQKRVVQAVSEADIVEVNFYPCIKMIDILPQDKPKIFVQHEIRYIRNERMLKSLSTNEKDIRFKDEIKAEEIKYLNKYDVVVTLTDTDKKELTDAGVTTPIAVSPAPVQAHFMKYTPWNGKLCYVGGYAHIPNREGVEWFIDNVYKECEELPFDIIGGGWPDSIRKTYQNISTKGFVDNIEEAVKGGIMVVPLLTGSGMRMKILDAAAMNIPFITTSVGVEGLDFKNGESCLIADTAEEFSKAISTLTSNPELQKSLAENAQKTYLAKYSTAKLSEIREEIYKQISKQK